MTNFAAAAPPGMVEFRCPDCNKLLRITANAIGKQALCPECRSTLIVPSPGAPAPGQPLTMADGATNNVAPTQPNFAPGLNPTPPVAPSLRPTMAQAPFQPTPQPAPAPQFAPAQSQPAPSSFSPATIVPSAPAYAPAPAMPQFSPGASSAVQQAFQRITAEIRKVYVGQDELVLGTMVALFSSGHVLIESVPGLGKTLFVRTLGRVLGCKFGRIQFTADLMPSDITGAPIFDMKEQEFRFHPGPVFTQLLLADEINRSPAKTHAALLEIMQEYRVTIERVSHKLERPFLVLATQNPIESEGTYNLPEAQLDRFMFKIVADYPSAQEEANVLRMHSQQIDLDQRLAGDLQTVSSPEEIMQMTKICGGTHVDEKLLEYINTIVRRTRQWPQFHMGASPRAGIALMQGARTLAAFHGRDYAVPDDVVQLALPALRHRVILSPEADVEGRKVDDLLKELIRTVEVPRL